MSRIGDIKESVDAKLDRLDARADALQAALQGTSDQVSERIGRHKREMQQALDKLTANIDEHKDLSDARKQAIRSEADNLNEQLTLSESAARETLAQTRRQIHQGVAKLEAQVEAAFSESKNLSMELLKTSLEAYAKAEHKLDAELEAAELHFAADKKKMDAAFDNRRHEMAQEIGKLKQRLGERAAQASGTLANFEAELRGGFEQIAKSMKDLFN
jgi:chromosome segregation ATPase